MNFYSQHFYDSSLIPTREEKEEEDFLSLVCGDIFENHNNKFGIYFVDVCGENKRTKRSTSWLHLEEAEEVCILNKIVF